MLIDITSFTGGPRQIENAVATQKTAAQVAVAERINAYIEFYQLRFLRRALGGGLGSLVDEYTKHEHNEPNEDYEKIVELLREPFADFVFFYMLRDMNVQPTITGLVQLKCANAYVSTLEKGVETWNRMVDGMVLFVRSISGNGVEDVVVDDDLLTSINNFNL